MGDPTYKLVELVGTSGTSIEDAVNTAMARASGSIRNIRWFELVETRGAVENGRVKQWQVTIKAGFTVDE